MIIQKIKSPIFNDLHTLNQNHTFTKDDFDYEVYFPSEKTFIENKRNYVFFSVNFFLKDQKIADELKEYDFVGDYSGGIYLYGDRGSEAKFSGKVGTIKSFHKDFNYRGTRGGWDSDAKNSKVSRLKKNYEELKNSLPEKIDKYFEEEVIPMFNDRIAFFVKKHNEKADSHHIDLFTGRRYENAFKKDWESDEQIKSLEKEKSPLKQQLEELEKKVKELDNQVYNRKIEMVRQDLEKYEDKLSDSAIEAIKKELDSGKAHKPRGRFDRWT